MQRLIKRKLKLKKLRQKNLPKKMMMKMMRSKKNLKQKTPWNYSHLPHLTFSISKHFTLTPPINKMLLISCGKITTLKDFLSGTLNILNTKEKELNSTTLLTSKTQLYKDLIHLENTSSDLSESMEKKETTKSEESGFGEEPEFLNTLKKIYPTSNTTNGLNLTTLMLNTKNSFKTTGLDSPMTYLLLMV